MIVWSKSHVARTQRMLEETSPSLWGNYQNIYVQQQYLILKSASLNWMFGKTTMSMPVPITLEELFKPFCSISDETTGSYQKSCAQLHSHPRTPFLYSKFEQGYKMAVQRAEKENKKLGTYSLVEAELQPHS